MWFQKKSSSGPYLAVTSVDAQNDDLNHVLPRVEECRMITMGECQDRSRGFRRTWIFAMASAILVILAVSGLFIHNKTHRHRSCSSPEIRREWRQLKDREKWDYISAVKCLHELPSRITGEGHLSDDFPWIHKRIGEISKNASPSEAHLQTMSSSLCGTVPSLASIFHSLVRDNTS